MHKLVTYAVAAATVAILMAPAAAFASHQGSGCDGINQQSAAYGNGLSSNGNSAVWYAWIHC